MLNIFQSTSSNEHLSTEAYKQLFDALFDRLPPNTPYADRLSLIRTEATIGPSKTRSVLQRKLDECYSHRDQIGQIDLHGKLFALAMEQGDLGAALNHDMRIQEITAAPRSGRLDGATSTDATKAIRHLSLGIEFMMGVECSNVKERKTVNTTRAKQYLLSALEARDDLPAQVSFLAIFDIVQRLISRGHYSEG